MPLPWTRRVSGPPLVDPPSLGPAPHRPHPLVAHLLWAPPPGPLFPILPGSSLPSRGPLCLCGLLPSSLAKLPPLGTPRPRPWAPPLLLTTPPRSFWSAGGSPYWSRCGAACRWDPEHCPRASRCTRTSSGRARQGEWVGGPQHLFPGRDTCFLTGCCSSTWN